MEEALARPRVQAQLAVGGESAAAQVLRIEERHGEAQDAEIVQVGDAVPSQPHPGGAGPSPA